MAVAITHHGLCEGKPELGASGHNRTQNWPSSRTSIRLSGLHLYIVAIDDTEEIKAINNMTTR